MIHDLDRLLADNFRREKALGLIGDLILGKVRLALRQPIHNFALQFVDACSLQSRNRNDRRELKGFLQRVDERQQLRFRYPIDLVESENRLAFKTLRLLQQQRIGIRQRAARVHHQEQNVDAFERRCDFMHHLAAERGVGFVQSRRVDENNLALRRCHDSLNAIARRLRFVGDDRNFLPDDAIQKRRFARVRPADNRDESRAVIGFFSQTFYS